MNIKLKLLKVAFDEGGSLIEDNDTLHRRHHASVCGRHSLNLTAVSSTRLVPSCDFLSFNCQLEFFQCCILLHPATKPGYGNDSSVSFYFLQGKIITAYYIHCSRSMVTLLARFFA